MKKILNSVLAVFINVGLVFSVVACTHSTVPNPTPPPPKKTIDLSKIKFSTTTFYSFDDASSVIKPDQQNTIENNIKTNIIGIVNDISIDFSFKEIDFNITFSFKPLATFENPISINIKGNNKQLINQQKISVTIKKQDKLYDFNTLTDSSISDFPRAFEYKVQQLGRDNYSSVITLFNKDFSSALNFFWGGTNFISTDYNSQLSFYRENSQSYGCFQINISSNNILISKNSTFTCNIYIYVNKTSESNKVSIDGKFFVINNEFLVGTKINQSEYDYLVHYSQLLLMSYLTQYGNFFGAQLGQTFQDNDYRVSNLSIQVNDILQKHNSIIFEGNGGPHMTGALSGQYKVTFTV